MPYDSPYVVVCRLLALLQAFVKNGKEYDSQWSEASRGSAPKLTADEAVIFKSYFARYAKLVRETIRDLSTPTTPPEFIEVIVPPFQELLDDKEDGFATELQDFVDRFRPRYWLKSNIRSVYRHADRWCAGLELCIRRYQSRSLILCMGLHPRLGKKSVINTYGLTPELLMLIMEWT
jgi:hypothetical protein